MSVVLSFSPRLPSSSALPQVIAFLWTCLFCFLAKRISLAIGVIKEAGRSIAAMPVIVLWPLVELVRAVWSLSAFAEGEGG